MLAIIVAALGIVAGVSVYLLRHLNCFGASEVKSVELDSERGADAAQQLQTALHLRLPSIGIRLVGLEFAGYCIYGQYPSHTQWRLSLNEPAVTIHGEAISDLPSSVAFTIVLVFLDRERVRALHKTSFLSSGKTSAGSVYLVPPAPTKRLPSCRAVGTLSVEWRDEDGFHLPLLSED